MKTPSAFKKYLEARSLLIGEITAGLNGKPFHWGGGETSSKRPLMKQLGITLITRTAMEKRGLKLRRGAKPVGRVYFTAPISRDADVYVLECQCVPDDTPKALRSANGHKQNVTQSEGGNG